MELHYKNGKLEYPPDHVGRRKYVTVRGFPYSVPACYCYLASDGRWYYAEDEVPTGMTAPMIMRDISAYRSPIDGSMVTSRSEHRSHMRKHGVIEVGNERLDYPKVDRPMSRQERVNDIKRAMGVL